MSAARISAFTGLLLGLLASTAGAHMMPRGHGTLNVVGDKAYIIASLPVEAFAESHAGIVKDGVLTALELKANKASLRAAVIAGLLVNADGAPARFGTIRLDLPAGAGHAADRSGELTVMIVAHLPAKAKSLTVQSTLWAQSAETLKIDATVTVRRKTTRREIGELSPQAPAHEFFKGEAHDSSKTTSTHHHHGGVRHSH